MTDIPIEDEATKPVDLSFLDQLKKREPILKDTPQDRMQRALDSRQEMPKTPARRGRPPGSKNKPKEANVIDVKSMTKAEAEARRKKKDELAAKIVATANDNIMALLMSQGVPSMLLYKPGREPSVAPNDSPYQDLGYRVSIKPMQANAVASFIIALENNEKVGTVVSALSGDTDSTLSLVLKGVFATVMVGQYVKGVVEVYKMMQPLLEANRAYQEAQKRSGKDQT